MSLVSGSGSAVFGLFRNREEAERDGPKPKAAIHAVLVATLTRDEHGKGMSAGVSPSGKAAGFGPAIRGFESSRPSSGYKRASRE